MHLFWEQGDPPRGLVGGQGMADLFQVNKGQNLRGGGGALEENKSFIENILSHFSETKENDLLSCGLATSLTQQGNYRTCYHF